MRTVLAAFWISLLAVTVSAEESPLPKSLVGFLKPGMKIGVLATEKDSFIDIYIYTDEEFEVRVASQLGTPIEKLAKDIPALASAIERKRKEILAEEAAKYQGDPPAGELKFGLPARIGERYLTVIAVGDDYVLTQAASKSGFRRVYSAHTISKIQWLTEIEVTGLRAAVFR